MDGRSAQARQHPAVLPALIAFVLTAACAPARPAAASARAPARETARSRACSATDLPAPAWSDLPAQRAAVGATVTRVAVRESGAVPMKLVRGAVHMKPGEPLDPGVVAADIRRIWRLEAFSDVRAEVEPHGSGVELVYVVRERPLVGRVFREGDRGARLGVHPGGLYDPARLQRLARALVSTARDGGHLQARAEVRGVRVDRRTVDLCVTVNRGPRFVIDRIVFEGNAHVDASTLRAALHTGDGKVNRAGRPYRADLFRLDRVWLSAIYWDRGMLDVRIGMPRVTLHPERGTLTVRVDVHEGPVFHVRRLSFRGRLLSSSATYRKLLGMKRGEVFERSRFMAGLERIRDYHLWRGRRSLDVEPDPHLDAAHHAVDVVVKVEKAR